jgi:hypothetical protein
MSVEAVLDRHIAITPGVAGGKPTSPGIESSKLSVLISHVADYDTGSSPKFAKVIKNTGSLYRNWSILIPSRPVLSVWLCIDIG